MHKHAWAVLFIAAALSACNLTGQDEHEERTLSLVQTSPAPEQAEVDRSVRFSADFDAALDPASVDSATAWIAGPEGNAIPAGISVNGSRLEITPAFGLPGGTTYTVNLAAGIAGRRAGELGSSQWLRFTTKAQAWQPELTQVSRFGEYEALLWPDIAADDRGNVVVAWVQPAGETSLVSVVRKDGATGAWSETATFPTTSSLSGWPSLFTGTDGDARLVWSEGDAESVHVFMATYRGAAASWSSPVRIDAFPEGCLGVTPLVEPNGVATLVCWTHEHLLVMRQDGQGQWGQPMPVERAVEGRMRYAGVRLVADGAGNVLLAWVQVDEGSTMPVYATRFDRATGQWAGAQHMGSSDMPNGFLFAQGGSLNLGVDGMGNATMAWRGPDDSGVFVSRFDASTSRWTATEKLAQGRQVGAAVDRAGYATVMWQQEDGLYASRRAPRQGTWSQPVLVASRVSMPAFTEGPHLLADVAGNVTAVYAVPEGSPIRTSRFNVDSGQ